MLPVHYFEGIDPAPSEGQRSDDGALVVGRATPRNPQIITENRGDWYFDLIYARRLTHADKASARQWAGIIHQHYDRWRFEKIVMDPNGGGTLIKRELASSRQLINGHDEDRVPIGDLVDAPTQMVQGRFILHLFKRGDPGVEMLYPGLAGDDLLNDALYAEFREALGQQWIHLPPLVEDFLGEPGARQGFAAWPEERQWSLRNLSAFVTQARNVVVQTNPDGTMALTKRGARQFAALGKKDLVSAAMYCYMAFLIWLRMGEWGGGAAPEDAGRFSGWSE